MEFVYPPKLRARARGRPGEDEGSEDENTRGFSPGPSWLEKMLVDLELGRKDMLNDLEELKAEVQTVLYEITRLRILLDREQASTKDFVNWMRLMVGDETVNTIIAEATKAAEERTSDEEEDEEEEEEEEEGEHEGEQRGERSPSIDIQDDSRYVEELVDEPPSAEPLAIDSGPLRILGFGRPLKRTCERLRPTADGGAEVYKYNEGPEYEARLAREAETFAEWTKFKSESAGHRTRGSLREPKGGRA